MSLHVLPRAGVPPHPELGDLVARVVALAAAATRHVALRVDDVGLGTGRTRDCVEAVLARGAAVNLAVVPAACTPAVARWVRELCARHGALVEVHQHGWRHVNHEPSDRKQEFGEARDYAAKLADLRLGWDRLQQQLGSAVVPVFCPPWNRMDRETAGACRAAGFRAVSAWHGLATPLPPGLVALPATIDWDRLGGGRQGVLVRAADTICARLLAGERPIVMLHPERMRDDATRALLDLVESATAAGCRPVTFGELLIHETAGDHRLCHDADTSGR